MARSLTRAAAVAARRARAERNRRYRRSAKGRAIQRTSHNRWITTHAGRWSLAWPGHASQAWLSQAWRGPVQPSLCCQCRLCRLQCRLNVAYVARSNVAYVARSNVANVANVASNVA